MNDHFSEALKAHGAEKVPNKDSLYFIFCEWYAHLRSNFGDSRIFWRSWGELLLILALVWQ